MDVGHGIIANHQGRGRIGSRDAEGVVEVFGGGLVVSGVFREDDVGEIAECVRGFQLMVLHLMEAVTAQVEAVAGMQVVEEFAGTFHETGLVGTETEEDVTGTEA